MLIKAKKRRKYVEYRVRITAEDMKHMMFSKQDIMNMAQKDSSPNPFERFEGLLMKVRALNRSNKNVAFGSEKAMKKVRGKRSR